MSCTFFEESKKLIDKHLLISLQYLGVDKISVYTLFILN